MIGTLTTKLGLVHAVAATRALGVGYTTACLREYVKSVLDVSSRVVTCLWCITHRRWPSNVTAQSISSPCAEAAYVEETNADLATSMTRIGKPWGWWL